LDGNAWNYYRYAGIRKLGKDDADYEDNHVWNQ